MSTGACANNNALFKELRQREEQFAGAFHCAPIGMAIIAPDGRWLKVNQAFCDLVGYPEAELLAGAFQHITHPDDREANLAQSRRMLAGELTTCRLEIRYAHRSGGIVWGLLSRSLVRDDDGQPRHFIAQILDITDKKTLENVQTFISERGWRAKEEEFFPALARLLSETLALEFVCIDRLTGNGLMARTVAVYHHGRFRDNIEYALKDTPCGDVVGKTICCFPRDVATLFPNDPVLQEINAESYAGITLWDIDDQPVGLIALIGEQPFANQELVETVLHYVAPRAAGELVRMLADEALLATMANLQEARRLAGIGNWTWEIATGERTWSEEVYRIFRRDPALPPLSVEEVSGYYTPDCWAGLTRHMQAALESGQPYEYDAELLLPDGSSIWVVVRGEVLRGEDGAAAALRGTLQDITSRKELETKLRDYSENLELMVHQRTEELSEANRELEFRRTQSEAANRAKSEFLAVMSHELRTPLNTILGNCEILREQVYGALTPDQLKSVRTIESSGRHLLELISDILDLSKIEADKLALHREDVNLESLCILSLAFIKEPADKKKISISYEYRDIPETIHTDSLRLKQILVNLLSNAVKFTDVGGQVGVSVAGDGLRRWVTFTVWDTGIGISAEDMSRLFQPFVQVDSSLARRHEGTGLGLALSSRLATQLGGTLEVTSEVGTGSRFTLTMPLADHALKPAEPLTAALDRAPEELRPADGPPENSLILLTEDNPATVEVFSGFLRARGFRVITAGNGAEAVLRAQEDGPELILMDIQLPDMNGLEAIRRIRNFLTSAHVPIIALTALAMPGDKERCLEAGADTYLSKPVSLKELEATIMRLLTAGRSA